MKASTAQNRRANDRLKRNSSGGSTFETNRLSFDAYPYLGASLGLTFFAASWVVLEFFFVEEELLSSRENEVGVAVNALQNPVRKFHGLLSAASEIQDCRVRVESHGARLGVGKYVSGLTVSQPGLGRSRANRIPAMRYAPKHTIPQLTRGIPASGSNVTGLCTAGGSAPCLMPPLMGAPTLPSASNRADYSGRQLKLSYI